jgi:hypothetical protein
VVVVENDHAACRPGLEVLCQELGKRAGQSFRRVPDTESLLDSVACAGHDRVEGLGEPGRERADVG